MKDDYGERELAKKMRGENTDDNLYTVIGPNGKKSRMFGHLAHAQRRLDQVTKGGKKPGGIGATPRGSLTQQQQKRLSG